MKQIQFSLIKKKKDWTSRTLANPNLIFTLPPPNLRQSGRHMCITSKSDEKNYLYVQNTEAHWEPSQMAFLANVVVAWNP